MLPTGVGGSWSSDDVLGFGWGTESRLSCKYMTSLGSDVLHRDLIWTSATDAYFVSSALVICEPPSHVFSRDASLYEIARYTYSDTGLEVMATITSNSAVATADASRVALHLVPEPILSSVSPQSGLAPDGGCIVTIAWEHSTFKSRSERSSHAISRLSCAFGTIAPVSMSILDRHDNSGSCVTPAVTIAARFGTSFVGKLSRVDTFLYLPNTGRLSAGTGIRYVPKMSAPAASFVFVSSTSASIGAAFDVFKLDVSTQVVKACNFIGYESATVLQPFCKNFATCLSPILPGGFVVVELTDLMMPGCATGARQQIEIYGSPLATFLIPSNALSGGGTIISAIGVDLLPSCSDGVNSLPELQCVFGAHSTKAAAIVSSALALCEVPPQFHTSSVWTEAERFHSTENMDSVIEYPFAVAREGDTLVRTGLSVRYIDSPIVLKVFPNVVSADNSGTVVAVYGRNLGEEVHGARCVFGTIHVAATARNNTHVECTSPTHIAATVPLAIVCRGVWGVYDLAFDFV